MAWETADERKGYWIWFYTFYGVLIFCRRFKMCTLKDNIDKNKKTKLEYDVHTEKN